MVCTCPKQFLTARPNMAGKETSLALSGGLKPSNLYLWPTTDYEFPLVVVVPVPAQSSVSQATSTISPTTTSATTACNTASPIIQNGGFESGSLSPWVVQTGLGQSSGSVVSGGSSYYAGSGSIYTGGNYAFLANLQTPNSPYAGTVSQTLSQTLNTCAGTNYTVTADYNFEYHQGGVCTLTMMGLSASTASTSTGWHRMTTTFKAGSNAASISFAMSCSTPGEIGVDAVNITKTVTS